jgi:hypothetical protein
VVRASPWQFHRHGESGLEVSELFPALASHADKLAVIRSCYSDVFDHAPGIYHTLSGSQPSAPPWTSSES